MHMQLDDERHASNESRYFTKVCVHTPDTFIHQYTHTIHTQINTCT